MDLKAAVGKYLEVVKEFHRPMQLSKFGLPGDELEAMLSGWDEDYQLHRHFELLAPSGESPATVCRVNGQSYSAILFKESIRDVLE